MQKEARRWLIKRVAGLAVIVTDTSFATRPLSSWHWHTGSA